MNPPTPSSPPMLSHVASPPSAKAAGRAKGLVKKTTSPATAPVATKPRPVVPTMSTPVTPQGQVSPRSIHPVSPKPLSERGSPRASTAFGGVLAASYPAIWRSQGGLAAELGTFLELMREDFLQKQPQPSTLQIENLCQCYDLGTELERFQLRCSDLCHAVKQAYSREVLKGHFDMLSEASWWLLQAYQREELRSDAKITQDQNPSTPVAAQQHDSDEQEDSYDDESSSSVAAVVVPEKHPSKPLPIPDANAQLYSESDNVLDLFRSRCIERLQELARQLAETEDSALWASMVGKPNVLQPLLRELELGANDPTTRDLGARLFLAVEATFDQYTGLRQVGDFRGLPEAPFLLNDATQTVARLHEHSLALALRSLENLELLEEHRLAVAFETVCSELLKEYHAFKDGVLLKLGFCSSLKEKDSSGRNLNSSVVLSYTREVMAICDSCVEQLTQQFNERVQQIDFLAPSKQGEIFASMGGRQDLAQRVRAHLFQVKPWARESIQVQTQSLMQREIFGRSREDIINILNQSKEQMLSGFRSLVEGRIPEPLNRMSEIIEHMDSLLEPFMKKRTGLRTNKSGKVSSRGKKGQPGKQTQLAFSGMTIRGNMFKDEDVQDFLDK